MGFFTLAITGGAFILVGAWEAFTFSGQNPNQTSLQTPSPSSTSTTQKNPSSSSSISFISISIFSFLFILYSLFSLLDAVNSSDGVGSALQLQLLAIASLFLFYGVMGVLVNSSNSLPLPSSLLGLIGLFAFVEEFLLFYLQRKDPSGIENRYFDILLVPITVCVFSTLLDLKSPESIFPKLARGVGLMSQGMWFVQMGLSFYTGFVAHGCSLHEKSRGNYTVKCKGHPEYHRARAIATLQFNCHLALIVILVSVLYSIVARRNGGGGGGDFMRYKPLEAEMQPSENQSRFTLEFDDDDIEGEIKEDDNVVKQKEGVVEIGLNGHVSH